MRARYKVLLESKGQLEAWYEFENKATEKALRNWCKENGIELKEGYPADEHRPGSIGSYENDVSISIKRRLCFRRSLHGFAWPFQKERFPAFQSGGRIT